MAACGYHFEGKAISRSEGRSAVNAAAYRTGEKLHDERLGQTFDYSRKQGVEFVHHVAPKTAPGWAFEIEAGWNAAERADTKKNATPARDYIAAFPHQLNARQREHILKDFMREEFSRKGFMATGAIHAPDKDGDEKNYHAHIMFSERPLDENGFAKNKDRRFSSYATRKEALLHLKERWAELGARQLERAGFQLEADRWRHGHLTLAEQRALAMQRGDTEYAERCDREATKHLGPHATRLERDGDKSELGDVNREITARNRDRAELKKLEAELRAAQAEIAGELQRQHEAALADVRREREAKAAAAAAQEKEKAKQSAATPDSMTAKLDAWQKAQREKENAAAQVRAAWGGSSGDGLTFMVKLGGEGLNMARNEWGSYVLVSDKGKVHGLSAAQYGPDAKAIKRAIDAAQADHAALQIPGVDEIRHEQEKRREQEKKEREERYQQEKQERSYQASLDLTPAQATIRQSYGASMSGQSFTAALEDNGFILTRASKGDVETAQVMAGLAAHRKDAPEWQTRVTIKEGDYLVVDGNGHAHRLTERTTGADRNDVAGKLANLAATPLPDVREGKEIMRDVRQQTATEKRMERERQRQHKSNSRAAIRYATPAPHPSWQAQPWSKTQQVDLTPRPMHPDAHADRMRQQQAERHRQSEDERETRKHNPAMVKDAAQETTDRPQDSSDGQQKTAQQERKEKLLKLALANIEARGLDRGGGRTRDR